MPQWWNKLLAKSWPPASARDSTLWVNSLTMFKQGIIKEVLLFHLLFPRNLFTSCICIFVIYPPLFVIFYLFCASCFILNFSVSSVLYGFWLPVFVFSWFNCFTCVVYLMCSTCASFCHFPLVFLSLCLFFSCCRFAVLRMFHICFCGLFCCVLDYFWISCFIFFNFIYFSSSWSMDLFIPCTACFIILVSYSH